MQEFKNLKAPELDYLALLKRQANGRAAYPASLLTHLKASAWGTFPTSKACQYKRMSFNLILAL
ncbi:hypothetical protein [Heliorestis convoluta]|uniref:hypothetical protein n=1 Tax=Heliorestis convoluta TaxID=356322 RepID=UPI00129B06C6|nr:hypothetical protein [Heliorestis convoluta]